MRESFSGRDMHLDECGDFLRVLFVQDPTAFEPFKTSEGQRAGDLGGGEERRAGTPLPP